MKLVVHVVVKHHRRHGYRLIPSSLAGSRLQKNRNRDVLGYEPDLDFSLADCITTIIRHTDSLRSFNHRPKSHF